MPSYESGMGIGEIGAELAREWHMITQAPWLFLGSVVLVGVVIWKFVLREFATRLANANSTIEMLKEKLDRSEVSDAIAIASATQAQVDSAKTPAPVPAPAASKKVRRHAAQIDAISIESIVAMFEGRTELQMAGFIAEHKGAQVIARGAVRSVSQITNGSIGVSIQTKGTLVMGVFAENLSALAKLQIGEDVEFQGKLERVTQIAIFLERCEFI